MKKTAEIRFTKLHGLGNDFIVTRPGRAPGQENEPGWRESRRVPNSLFWGQLAKAICARQTGIGADGFLVVLPPRRRDCDARVRFFNADGSEAEMSGNGIRCVAGFLSLAASRNRTLGIETAVGRKEIETIKARDGWWMFRVAMGDPVLKPAKIPFRARSAAGPVVNYPLATRLGRFRATVTSMGNPHCSIFFKNFNGIDWRAIGREIENHPLFPNRTNVEFARVISRREIEVRYWERGVGQTASSGTGSCAAAVASVLNGFTGRRLTVRTLAGNLEVLWPEGGEVSLTGPAELIAHGVYRFMRK
ncbi:MAG: diaminopimelate epimerase [Terriglobia bacterium]